jgi:hypothetical protein
MDANQARSISKKSGKEWEDACFNRISRDFDHYIPLIAEGGDFELCLDTECHLKIFDRVKKAYTAKGFFVFHKEGSFNTDICLKW